jgi:hypothetical protein
VSDDPKSAVARLLATAVLAVSVVLGAGGAAAASTVQHGPAVPMSQGSVPSEVARYAADPDGLLHPARR